MLRKDNSERVKVAQQVNAARATRSPKQQLALLDQRLGTGQGAARERARLQAQIDAAKPA